MYSHPAVVVSCVNPKGGVGKSTVAVHLGVAAHRDGHDTALVDTDPQGSILDWHRLTEEGYDGPRVRHIDAGTAVSTALRGAPGTAPVGIDSNPSRMIR